MLFLLFTVLHQAFISFRQYDFIKVYPKILFVVKKNYSHVSYFLTKKISVMKSIISKTFTMAAIAVAMLSFTTNFGGEGFEI